MTSLMDQAEAALRAGQYAQARSALEQALAGGLDARLESEARSMLGLALVALGEISAALEYLRKAVAAEPGEAMFRYNLGRGLSAAGEHLAAVAEHAEALRLAPSMPALEIALAQAHLAAGQAGEARPVLERYAANPQASPALARMLVQARAGSGDSHAALDAARRLVPADPVKADAQGRADTMMAASLAHAAMEYDEAIGLLRGLVRRNAADADAATVLAQLLLWTDGPEAARELLLSARQAGAASPRMLVELLTLGEAVESEAEELSECSDVAASDRADLLLALAQAADRAGDASRAWELAARGKALIPAPAQRDWRATLMRQLAIYRQTKPGEFGQPPPQHLYLLGSPRSGQSLLQSILAAAPGVASVGERGALLQHLLFRDEEIAAMSPGQLGGLLRELSQADRRGLERLVGTPQLMVDKSPLHLVIAGNIARVHPSARFAAVLRDPADVALSIWLRRFPPVYDYANDFSAILDHLDFGLDALAAWLDEGRAIRLIDFGEFLTDPAAGSAQLLEWLGLPWSETYLDPANRTQPVPTYSAAQVRQPVGLGASSGAGPYLQQLEPFAGKIEALRNKQSLLLSQQ